jgi:hypothetical protein
MPHDPRPNDRNFLDLTELHINLLLMD